MRVLRWILAAPFQSSASVSVTEFYELFFPVAMLIIHIRKVCNASSYVNV